MPGGGISWAYLSRVRFLFIAILVLCQFVSAQAATSPTEKANQEASRLQQQNYESQRELERQQKRDVFTSTPDKGRSLPPAPADSSADKCFPIEHIKLEGASLLSSADRQKLSSRYLNKCLTLGSINQLLHEITNLYIERGYITTRAYLKPQNLSSRTLTVTVLEGRIEGFIQPEGGKDSNASFPAKAGDPLNLRALEQGIDNLNRLSSVDASMTLEPGSLPGDSQIRLTKIRHLPLHLEAGIDNNGQETTGVWQGHLSTSLDHPFSDGDYLNLYAKSDIERGSFQKSRNLSILYELPLGWNLLRIRAQDYSYNSRVKGTSQFFATSGGSNRISASLKRTLHRDQHGKVDLTFSLDRQAEENYIEGVKLLASSQSLSSIRTTLSYHRKIPRGSIDISLGTDRGFNILGARRDDPSDPFAPKAQFNKATCSLYINQRYSFRGSPVLYNLTARGQYSGDRLFSSEQLVIGGLYSVRGYKENSLSGERGGYLRNEISLPRRIATKRTKLLNTYSPYLGLDWGMVKQRSDRNDSRQLAGWTMGVRTSGRNLSSEVSVSRAIDTNEEVQSKNLEVYFSLSLRT